MQPQSSLHVSTNIKEADENTVYEMWNEKCMTVALLNTMVSVIKLMSMGRGLCCANTEHKGLRKVYI